MCSLNLVLNALPVCPVYFILQSGQVSWYTPHFSYVGWGFFCSQFKCLLIVLLVEKVTFTLVCLKSFMMNLVSFPTYVNFAHLCFWGCVLWSCFFFFGSIVGVIFVVVTLLISLV